MAKVVEVEAEQLLPVPFEDKLPDIPEEVIKDLLATAEDVVIWVKPRGNSFQVDETTVPFSELVGRIIEIKPYLVKWENNKPNKIPYIKDELDWPEGYEPRADVVLMTQDGGRIGISLAKSSFRRKLCPYVKNLADQGKNPTDVVTRFMTWEAKTNLGTFNVVKPTEVDPGELAVQASFDKADNDDIPF